MFFDHKFFILKFCYSEEKNMLGSQLFNYCQFQTKFEEKKTIQNVSIYVKICQKYSAKYRRYYTNLNLP